MPMSHYPNGFAQGLTIRGMPLAVAHPGKVFWVSSTEGSNGNDGTFDRPFGTVDYAVGRCTANRGDIIAVKPAHVENLTAAAAVALDVAGVALIGLGSGSMRPTFNFTTAVAADIKVTAANVTMVNFLLTGGIDALTTPLEISAADFSFINCETRDVTGQATNFVAAGAGADRLLIDGWFHNGAAAAGANSALLLVGMDNFTMRNFKIIGNFTVSAVDIASALVDADIHSGYCWNKNASDLFIRDGAGGTGGSTGKIGPNIQLMLADNAANITEAITGATFHLFDPIYVCNLAGEKAMLINTTASTDA